MPHVELWVALTALGACHAPPVPVLAPASLSTDVDALHRAFDAARDRPRVLVLLSTG